MIGIAPLAVIPVALKVWRWIRKHGRLIVGSMLVSALLVVVAGGYVYGYVQARNAEALERELDAARLAGEVLQRNFATAEAANADWTAQSVLWNAAVQSWAKERTAYRTKLAELRTERDAELAAREAAEQRLADQVDAAAPCTTALDQLVEALATTEAP